MSKGRSMAIVAGLVVSCVLLALTLRQPAGPGTIEAPVPARAPPVAPAAAPPLPSTFEELYEHITGSPAPRIDALPAPTSVMLRQWVLLQREMLRGDKPMRALLLSCEGRLCYGFADRMKGIIFAAYLALLSRRCLFIAWPGREAELDSIFVPHKVDWRLPRELKAKPWRETVIINHPSRVLAAGPWVQSLLRGQGSAWEKVQLNLPIARLLGSAAAPHPELARLVHSTHFAPFAVVTTLLRPSAALRDSLLAQRSVREAARPLTCVHVRTGAADGKPPPTQELYKLLAGGIRSNMRALRPGKGKGKGGEEGAQQQQVFVAADSDEALAAIGAASRLKVLAANVTQRAHIVGKHAATGALLSAATDYFLLTTCDGWVTSFGSGFGVGAAMFYRPPFARLQVLEAKRFSAPLHPKKPYLRQPWAVASLWVYSTFAWEYQDDVIPSWWRLRKLPQPEPAEEEWAPTSYFSLMDHVQDFTEAVNTARLEKRKKG